MEITEKEKEEFIEEYEKKYPEKVWNEEAEKICSIEEENSNKKTTRTLYKFRGKYYIGTANRYREVSINRYGIKSENYRYSTEQKKEIKETEGNITLSKIKDSIENNSKEQTR